MGDSRPPIVLSLLGPSGAGKTTLSEALVRRWTERGLRVGYLKHASHGFEMDRPGKDSERVARAGADGVAVTGPGGLAYLERGGPADPRAMLDRFFGDRDVVVLEGFRGAGFPAVVLAGDREPAEAMAEALGPVLAVVLSANAIADGVASRGRVPRFARGDVDGLAGHLEEVLGVGAAAT